MTLMDVALSPAFIDREENRRMVWIAEPIEQVLSRENEPPRSIPGVCRLLSSLVCQSRTVVLRVETREGKVIHVPSTWLTELGPMDLQIPPVPPHAVSLVAGRA